MLRSAPALLSLGIVNCTFAPDVPAAVDAPDAGYAYEASRDDAVCSESPTAEAAEPLSWLTATCIAFVSVGVHFGCSRGLLQGYCPRGTVKVIHDLYVETSSVSIDCDLLQDIVCGVGAVTAGELVRNSCGAVP